MMFLIGAAIGFGVALIWVYQRVRRIYWDGYRQELEDRRPPKEHR